MTEEKDMDNIVEILTDDGTVLKCELYDIIEVNGKEYALLTQVDGNKDSEDEELVLMKYIEEDGEVYLETIEDDAEFEEVSKYIEELDEEDDEE